MHQPFAISRIPACLASIILAASFFQAEAHAATANVHLDWDSFQINVIDTNLADGITPTLEWIGQSSQISIVLDGIGWLPFNAFAFDWLASGSDGHATPDLTLNAVYSLDMLYAEATSDFSVGGVIRAERYGNFRVTGDARVEASIHAVVHSLVTTGELSQGGHIQADANLFFGDNTATALSQVAYLASDISLNGSLDAVLTASLDMSGGDMAYLYMQPGVFVTAVPEPASWSLMLLGIALVASRAARRDGK